MIRKADPPPLLEHKYVESSPRFGHKCWDSQYSSLPKCLVIQKPKQWPITKRAENSRCCPLRTGNVNDFAKMEQIGGLAGDQRLTRPVRGAGRPISCPNWSLQFRFTPKLKSNFQFCCSEFRSRILSGIAMVICCLKSSPPAPIGWYGYFFLQIQNLTSQRAFKMIKMKYIAIAVGWRLLSCIFLNYLASLYSSLWDLISLEDHSSFWDKKHKTLPCVNCVQCFKRCLLTINQSWPPAK